MTEQCKDCGHEWHGMMCDHVTEKFYMGMAMGAVVCQCPGQFKSFNEGPKTTTKGKW